MSIKQSLKQSFIFKVYKKITGALYLNILFKKDFQRSLNSYKHVLNRFFVDQPVEFKLGQNDKCLLLAPHPDDESIGCGGLLLSNPDKFNVICLTDGRFGGTDLTLASQIKLIEERKSEFTRVMNNANIKKYKFLDIEDKTLKQNYNLFSNLDISDYDYIFIPNFLDINPDHKSVTVHLQQLLKEKEHKNSLKIAFYEVWSALSLPNYYFEITNNLQNKLDLINQYESQLKLWKYTDIIHLNKYRGFIVNKGYAEAYTIIDKETFLKL